MATIQARAIVAALVTAIVGINLVGCQKGGSDPILDKKDSRDSKIQQKQQKAASDE